MKEIIAIVRMNMMNQTKKALTEAGVDAFFAHEANGRDGQTGRRQDFRAADQGFRPGTNGRSWNQIDFLTGPRRNRHGNCKEKARSVAAH